MVDESSRAVLFLLSVGCSVEEVLARFPSLGREDVAWAAAEGLVALEVSESREDRVARVRERFPRAFLAWSEEEDARLVLRWREGVSVAELVRVLGRPRGGVVMRLEKLLGPAWRVR